MHFALPFLRETYQKHSKNRKNSPECSHHKGREKTLNFHDKSGNKAFVQENQHVVSVSVKGNGLRVRNELPEINVNRNWHVNFGEEDEASVDVNYVL